MYPLELLCRNDIEAVPGCCYYAHLYFAEDVTLHWSKLFQAWAEYQNVENFRFAEGQQKGKKKEKKRKKKGKNIFYGDTSASSDFPKSYEASREYTVNSDYFLNLGLSQSISINK